jgi:DNA-binding response OmpR family regulator/Sec-independent protein translocase protein TatA
MAAYRVLVVEDNHEVRRMVTASIKSLGDEIDVMDVMSAEEALVINASLPLDLMILDIRLPGMSGLEMVTRMRKRKPDTKIILVTGMMDAAMRQLVSKAEVDAYFFKPLEISAFLEAVKHCLYAPPEQKQLESRGRTSAANISPPTRPVGHPAPVKQQRETTESAPFPTLLERLSNLKKQVKAVAALLVNDSGQVVEEAGTGAEITTGSTLLNALMHAFRSSLQVSHAMARGTSESLQYFVAPRQCIYLTPVGMKHVLFVVTVGYFGPDKLGTIYHAIHLAVRDIQAIIENEASFQKEAQNLQNELPAEVAIDKETLAEVENMFSQAANKGSKQSVDDFWESASETGALSDPDRKDVLSYEQARSLGLAPDENPSLETQDDG